MLNLAGFRLPPPPPQQHQAAKRCSNNNAGRQLKRTASVASTRRSSTTPRSPKSPRAITCLTTPVHQAEQLRYNLTENERFKHRAFTVRAQPAAVCSGRDAHDMSGMVTRLLVTLTATWATWVWLQSKIVTQLPLKKASVRPYIFVLSAWRRLELSPGANCSHHKDVEVFTFKIF